MDNILNCCYKNHSNFCEILKNSSREMVVFPHQEVHFQAFSDEILEIISTESSTMLIADHIFCHSLIC
jgi:hypothetical protein